MKKQRVYDVALWAFMTGLALDLKIMNEHPWVVVVTATFSAAMLGWSIHRLKTLCQ